MDVSTAILIWIAAVIIIVLCAIFMPAEHPEEGKKPRVRLMAAIVISLVAGGIMYGVYNNSQPPPTYKLAGTVTGVKDIVVALPIRNGVKEVTVTQVVFDDKTVKNLDVASAATLKIGQRVNLVCTTDGYVYYCNR